MWLYARTISDRQVWLTFDPEETVGEVIHPGGTEKGWKGAAGLFIASWRLASRPLR